MSEEKGVTVELTSTERDVLIMLIERELQGTRPLIDLQSKLRGTMPGVVPARPTEQRQDQRRG